MIRPAMNALNGFRSRMPRGALQKELGKRIVQRRERRGWKQAELAARLGVSRDQLGKWERGRNAPSLEDLAALSEVLEASLEQLGIGQGADEPMPEVEVHELYFHLSAMARQLKPYLKKK